MNKQKIYELLNIKPIVDDGLVVYSRAPMSQTCVPITRYINNLYKDACTDTNRVCCIPTANYVLPSVCDTTVLIVSGYSFGQVCKVVYKTTNGMAYNIFNNHRLNSDYYSNSGYYVIVFNSEEDKINFMLMV